MSNPFQPAPSSFVRAYPPAKPAPGPWLLLPFKGNDVVLEESTDPLESNLHLLSSSEGIGEQAGLYLGTLGGVPCVAYTLSEDAELPPHCKAYGLRSLYGMVDDDTYVLTGYASQLLHWWEEHLFCYHCGGAMESIAARRNESSWGKECVQCGRAMYPPVVPAVLLLIHDGGERLLLATKPGWGKRFSIVAGFVEPGETLEGCCAREAMEEVGVVIEDITYDGSQTWPFPHQIMIGFTARYVSGDIQIDATELADAQWFRYDELPDLPPPLSLSRQIIDRWLAQQPQ